MVGIVVNDTRDMTDDNLRVGKKVTLCIELHTMPMVGSMGEPLHAADDTLCGVQSGDDRGVLKRDPCALRFNRCSAPATEIREFDVCQAVPNAFFGLQQTQIVPIGFSILRLK